jgi:hypothetical protein
MENSSMLQFYSVNSNFFNYLFLGSIFIIIILISIYWYLSFRYYIKTKDNTIDPHLISELKAPSKIFYLLLIAILSGLFFIFLEFFFANQKENLSSFKYMFLKEDNVLFSNSKNVSYTMDTQIPLINIDTIYVNKFDYKKFSNINREFCQISFKINQKDKTNLINHPENKNNMEKTKPKNIEKDVEKDLDNTFTITIPKKNIINDISCIEVAKQITYKINDYKTSLNLPTIGLLKTTETKPILYNENRENTLLIQSWIKLLTKPGSFFSVE